MTDWRKNEFLILLRGLLMFLAFSLLVILIASYFLPRGGRIIHIYQVDGKRQLIVDNWDCGAACSTNTKVYLRSDTWHGKSNKTLLSCKYVQDIVLSDVKSNSAKIEYMDQGFKSADCTYNQGDYIHF